MIKDIERISFSPADSIEKVVRRLSEPRPKGFSLPSGVALVVDESDRLLGITTDGDIRRAIAGGVLLSSSIKRIMNPKPFTVAAGKDAGEMMREVAAEIKRRRWHKDHVEKIIVIDEKGRPADIVSTYRLWQASDVRFRRIGVVGLGFVGLTLGLTLADVGFEVVGVDVNKSVRMNLRKGKPTFFEEGIDRLLDEHLSRRFIVADSFEETQTPDVYVIAVGTPLDTYRRPIALHLRSAASLVGKTLKQGDLVVLRSTVPVGITRTIVVPILEKVSGLVAGEEFLVAFAPERTVEGKALAELRSIPQIIGGFNKRSAELAAGIFGMMTTSVVVVDSLEEAELAKLINNAYRDTNFGFANEVALIAERFGLDAAKVIQSANFGYERSRIPAPSPGVGGYCLDKDPHLLLASAIKAGYSPKIVKSARQVNGEIISMLASRVISLLGGVKKGKRAKIFILGFAFKGKPQTSDTRGSTTRTLINELHRAGFKNIVGYDPLVPASEIRSMKAKPESLRSGFKKADAVIIMTNHPSFENLPLEDYLRSSSLEVIFIDPWSLYDRDRVNKIRRTHYSSLSA